MDDESKPWLEKRFGTWEVSSRGNGLTVNCHANEYIEIDKLYGPLSAIGIRIILEFTNEKTDWVVQRENLSTNEWVEVTRFDCQLDWPKED